MGDFIIITLMVSSFWLLWEILRLVGMERLNREEVTLPAGEIGRMELLRCADSFEQLSKLFSGMAVTRDEISENDLQKVLYEVQSQVCGNCKEAFRCWSLESDNAVQRFYRIADGVLQGKDLNSGHRQALRRECAKGEQFLDAVADILGKARLNLIWRNRLMESRSAAAGQLYETACIIRRAADHICEVKRVDGSIRQQADIRLRMHGLILKDIWCVRESKGIQLYVTLRTAKKGRCISTKEAAELLSCAFGSRLVQDEQGRSVINGEYSTILFVSEPQYYISGGVARIAKDGEVVSGDNFSMFSGKNGQMILGLSDGMGSGLEAFRESETVIDLLEQFLGSGFDKEAAIRLIHTSMLLQSEGQSSATVDLCMADLYSGECEFVKIGASTTFLKKKNWVETITSTSMPMGILPEVDYECTRKKMEDGDYIIMVSDGVMDAFPQPDAEERIKDYLLETDMENVKALAKALLKYVLEAGTAPARDDMTVLVGALRRR